MALVQDLQDKLRAKLKEAVKMTDLEVEVIPDIKLEEPREEEHGDYATNLAMVLSGQAGMPPRKIAEKIVNNLAELDFLAQMEIAGPGFINFYFNNEWLYDVLLEINKQGSNYGQIDVGANKPVQIEFVSANPTGPLHVGHSRGAAVGDVLANILKLANFDVSKEYYINNAGNQMDLLGKSVAIRYCQLLGEDITLPEDAYHGAYIKEIAQEIVEQEGKAYLPAAQEEEIDYFREYAYEQLIANIEEDLKSFGVEFDNWFSERTLHPDSIEEVTAKLKEKDLIYEEEGALWFKATEFGDDKDRVVIKDDGTPTYLAADIAYHQNKYQRGFKEVINIWGADHHGYVKRMKSVVEALGYGTEALQIILVQMVSLLRDGKQLQMSKRSGNFVTLKDVVEEVGKDAARYFYVMRSTDSHLDFDLDLAKKESTDNPVYYIQYAHARICSILEQIEEEQIARPEFKQIDFSKLDAEAELNLIKKLADYPVEIAKSAKSREPHHIARFAYDLAAEFHKFYNKCRVLVDDQELVAARLSLVLATKQVLVNVLNLLGVSAPESM
ncbi:arginyl-tRNA synthetase [Halobacteroides halobius DSM 5150]|uniref:Arginine--tRNA ligase n=1 Tax=Halobacteroides halobius (strain ATCC 35273 / DSM 5150 / MD-1) TaxID=748449 RepID=L0KCV1_HALHC|nr:arginine--tRNA ligase [Halobacteroides halobius]AGB42365.1 arginyl-tRNA synthetase [Halobacteroides halobius DSM 5150]